MTHWTWDVLSDGSISTGTICYPILSFRRTCQVGFGLRFWWPGLIGHHCLQSGPVSPFQVTEDLPISPSKDLKSDSDLVKRIAATLHLQISQLGPEVTDSVYDIVQKDISMAIAFSIPGVVLLQHATEPWLKSSLVPVSSCRLDHMYSVQQKGMEFLFLYPKPNSW